MLSIDRSILFGIFILFALTACGGDEDAVADPIVLGSVQALFTPAGARWNDYVDGDEWLTASNDNPCAVGSPPCIHGGERRVVDVSARSSCAGLSATDDLDAFDWVCDASTGGARMVSTGLTDGKYLSDLLDFTTPGFRENAVTVFLNGTVFGATPSNVWWSNPVVINNSGGSLADTSTIYLVTEQPNPAASFQIIDHNIGLVIEPGLTLTGPGTGSTVIQSSTVDYLWFEGAIDAINDSNAIAFSSVRFSALINVTVENANSGVFLASASNNTLSGVTASNNANSGVFLANASNNNLSGVTASNNVNAGVFLSNSSNNTLSDVTASMNSSGVLLLNASNNNTLSDVTASNNNSGVRVETASNNNTLSDVTASNNANHGVVLSSSLNNTLSGVTASNNSSGVQLDNASNNNTLSDVTASNSITGVSLRSASNNNTLSGMTASNNTIGVWLASASNNTLSGVTASNNSSGVQLDNASNNTLSGVTASNNNWGVELDNASNNTLSGVTASNNNSGVQLDNASNNTFTGLLQVGNISDCILLVAGTAPGLNGDCSPNGSSDHTLVSGVSVATSFVGKVSSDDSTNTSPTNGAPTDFPDSPMTFDWSGFDNPYRGWGVDGSVFPSFDNRGRWISGPGRIWDWRLKIGDVGNNGNPTLLGVLAFPGGDDTLIHGWAGTPPPTNNCDAMVAGSEWNGVGCETVFLRHAVEIPNDGIGNDNTLCESGESCLYAPNIGSYQGHGELISAGTFIEGTGTGTLTGITLLRHTSGVPRWFKDGDGDGFGDPLNALAEAIAPNSTWVANNSDCVDDDPTINPNAIDINDFVDNNCDGQIDEDFRKYVFATSTTTNGNIGGLAGADAICQNLANSAVPTLPGTYVAWLSTSGNDARDRVTDNPFNTQMYVRTDNAEVARGFQDLVDGTLINLISRDESGNSVGGDVWSGTGTAGTYTGPACGGGGNWTSSNGDGGIGDISRSDSGWTTIPTGSLSLRDDCPNTLKLYCFQKK